MSCTACTSFAFECKLHACMVPRTAKLQTRPCLQERAQQQAARAEQRRFAQLAAWALHETLQESLPCQRTEPAAVTGQSSSAPDQLPAAEAAPAADASDAGLGFGPGCGTGSRAAEQAAGAVAWLSGALGAGLAQPEQAPAAWRRVGAMLLQLHAQAPALQHGPPQRALAQAAALALRPALCALACPVPRERRRELASVDTEEGPALGELAGVGAMEHGLGRSGAEAGTQQGSGYERLAVYDFDTPQAPGDAGDAAGGRVRVRKAWGFLAGNTLLRLLDLLPAPPGTLTPHPGALDGALTGAAPRQSCPAAPERGPALAHAGPRLSLAEQAAVAAGIITLLGEAAAGQTPQLTAATLARWAAGDAGPALRRAADTEALHMRAVGVRLTGFN